MDELIKERQLYKHYKGGVYRVVSVFVSEPDGIRMVMYQQPERPFKIYARPYAEFIVKFDEVKNG